MTGKSWFWVIVLSLGLPAVPLFIAHRSVAEEPATTTREWRLTKSISAAEAHQAAAADEKFVYAITNEKVAKYDRKSSERVAVSTGAALHLNSGFFLDGKLYCAHSNFPRLPEQSEIKVLDPESMQLTVFKYFGNFGGSLTWAVKREGHWWCNFAHYGAANDRTFVVQLDEKWQETGRWTYPPEVIRQIGLASISGGLWHDDSLLVTDHDHRVLYRLKVPRAGKVLEFVSQEKAPFTGQGIAFDPVTGGLVGIDRSKKEILFAELVKVEVKQRP